MLKLNRKNILLAWFISGGIASILSSLLSLFYWQFTYVQQLNSDWSPISDLFGMLMIMPFGWLMSVMTPAGWMSIVGLCLALYKPSFKPLIVSVIGALVFGLYWPKYFIAIMGV